MPKKCFQTCETCEYDVVHDCWDTPCKLCYNSFEEPSSGQYKCRCLLVRDGEDCPYYKEAKYEPQRFD